VKEKRGYLSYKPLTVQTFELLLVNQYRQRLLS